MQQPGSRALAAKFKCVQIDVGRLLAGVWAVLWYAIFVVGFAFIAASVIRVLHGNWPRVRGICRVLGYVAGPANWIFGGAGFGLIIGSYATWAPITGLPPLPQFQFGTMTWICITLIVVLVPGILILASRVAELETLVGSLTVAPNKIVTNAAAVGLLITCSVAFAAYKASRPNPDIAILTQWVAFERQQVQWIWADMGEENGHRLVCPANVTFYLRIHNSHPYQITLQSVEAEAYDTTGRIGWTAMNRIYAADILYYGENQSALYPIDERTNLQFLGQTSLQPYSSYVGLVLFDYPPSWTLQHKPSQIQITVTDIEGDAPLTAVYHSSDSDLLVNPHQRLINIPLIPISQTVVKNSEISCRLMGQP